jgi:hypothetical protein
MATEIIIEMAEGATPQDETLVACITSLLPGVAGVRRIRSGAPESEDQEPHWKKMQ